MGEPWVPHANGACRNVEPEMSLRQAPLMLAAIVALASLTEGFERNVVSRATSLGTGIDRAADVDYSAAALMSSQRGRFRSSVFSTFPLGLIGISCGSMKAIRRPVPTCAAPCRSGELPMTADCRLRRGGSLSFQESN